MKKHYFLLLTLLLTTKSWIVSNPTISFFFSPQPDGEKIVRKLIKPGKIAKHTIHGLAENITIAGIFATYAGYITASNHNGAVRFPRKTSESSVNLLITPEIQPVALFENTIRYWQTVPGKPLRFYSLKEVYDDTTKEYSWNTEKATLPSNNVIPLTTIIIIAKPSRIIVPLGIEKTIKTAHLTLPTIYVKRGINIVSNSAYLLNIRHLFKPVESKEQRTPLRLTTLLLD